MDAPYVRSSLSAKVEALKKADEEEAEEERNIEYRRKRAQGFPDNEERTELEDIDEEKPREYSGYELDHGAWEHSGYEQDHRA